MEIVTQANTWPEEAQGAHRVGRVKVHQTDSGRTAVTARSWFDGLTRGELDMVAAAGLKLHHQAMARAAHHTGTATQTEEE